MRDANELFRELKKEESEVSRETVDSAIEGLSEPQKKKLTDILSSPEKIKSLLRSEKAQEILQKLGKKN